ncbi:MAG: S8 family serine peptidase [Chitinispirillaceae bacterium]|nr:S8 family serine peptidase [Chitinispirillaceae bacterium]
MEQWERGKQLCIAVCLIALMFASLSVSTSAETNLKGGHYLVPGVDDYRLVVKFKPSLLPDLSPTGALQFPLAKSAASVSSFGRLVKNRQLRFKRFLECATEELQEARKNNGKLLDHKGFDRYPWMCLYEVDIIGIPKEQLIKLALELEQNDLVEYVSLEAAVDIPPPIDYPPTTPSFLTSQTYRGPNPGIDVDYAWTMGVRGAGLTIGDLEHSWGRLDHATQQVHEDLHNQKIAYGLPWRTDDYRDHGMAVMGLMLAGDNGFGITGSVPDARGLTYSIVHGDAAALRASIDSSKTGDIVLMEMQRNAPDGKLGPPDVNKTLWDLIKAATARGVIIVQTSGNGASNMDDPSYATYHSWGDNGSIIEGAGSANTSHNRLSFSTYGARVNMHGWGERVFTLGYGNAWSGSTDWRQSYSASFSGTSSSGPIVTSAVALLQSYAKEKKGRLLTCPQIRTILMQTGTPQGTGTTGHIGPLPNLRAAIRMVDSLYPSTEIIKNIVAAEAKRNGVYFSNNTLHYFVDPAIHQDGGTVTIALFDLKGSTAMTLVQGHVAAGHHSIALSGRQASPGAYLCRMTTKTGAFSAKVTIR